MPRWLNRLLKGGAKPPGLLLPRARLSLTEAPAAIYAVGDVHGRLDLLVALEAKILKDAARFEGEKLLVMLGDYVDRGPNAAQVIDHILSKLPVGLTRYCLAGNHEIAMLAFLDHPERHSEWLAFGGEETLRSYGIEAPPMKLSSKQVRGLLDSHIPPEHIDFLRGLPILLETPGEIFVHAGLTEGVPLAQQTDDDLIWTRDDFLSTYAEFGKTVIHGHTPRTEALVSVTRISIDTGAYATGKLTAVKLAAGRPPTFFIETASHPDRPVR